MQKDSLIDLADAVVAVKDQSGKVKLHPAVNVMGAITGGFLGALVGLILLSPLLGMIEGAKAAGVSDALADVGINDKFMRDLADTLMPGSSVLFVLLHKLMPDKMLEDLAGSGGRVLKSVAVSRERSEATSDLEGFRETEVKNSTVAAMAI